MVGEGSRTWRRPEDEAPPDVNDELAAAAQLLDSLRQHTQAAPRTPTCKDSPCSPSAWQAFVSDIKPSISDLNCESEEKLQERAAVELPSLRTSLTPRKRPLSSTLQYSDGADFHTSVEGASGGLRSRASAGQHSADSGELGPTQARATKSAGHAREGLVSSGHARLRCSRLNQASSTLHPILQLGWKPLCEVHCNGLTGMFLGGHDRDLYIQATSKEFRNLPPLDYSQGGSILSCSQFEKCAGRELSKKWKESIHVLGEGEGSKATLIAWLKRRAAHDFGSGVVGKTVWVCWCADAQYYRGTITHFNADTGKHQVRYSDRFVEDLHLPVEVLSFAAEQPHVTPIAALSPSAGTRLGPQGPATTASEEVPAPEASEPLTRSAPLLGLKVLTGGPAGTPASLLNQGSGVSVNSDYKLTAADIEALKNCEDGALDSLPSLAAFAAQHQGDLHSQPQQALPSTPSSTAWRASKLLQPADPSISQNSEAELSASLASEGEPLLQVPVKRPRTGAVSSRMAAAGGGVSSSWLQSLMPSSGPQSALPPPPGEGSDPSMADRLRWLHNLALHLDDVLALPQLTQPCLLGDLEEKPLSAAACFQALLAQGLQAEGAQGYYEAMALRYHHFAHTARLQKAKLVEFVLAALHQDRQRHSSNAAQAFTASAGAAMQLGEATA
ncbi:hypothetical protein WJX73_002646 [Symbiochloris irregularis]|uniref:Uncharacterized protein n=1 Tax=Symbiochloris irregularis TaxID=706552 RepID=A0AAW1PJT8_9CHLO